MNLLKETIKMIKKSGHTPMDIVFIGSSASAFGCTWDDFKTLANHEYDNGFGGANVAGDLEIFFSDGNIMWRDDYDGAEWWNYSTTNKIPANIQPLKSIFGSKVE